jgi:hypothetical protein
MLPHCRQLVIHHIFLYAAQCYVHRGRGLSTAFNFRSFHSSTSPALLMVLFTFLFCFHPTSTWSCGFISLLWESALSMTFLAPSLRSICSSRSYCLSFIILSIFSSFIFLSSAINLLLFVMCMPGPARNISPAVRAASFVLL